MAQKSYSITQGGDLASITVASDATDIGANVIRLIVKDTINQRQMVTLIEQLTKRLLQDNYPF